VVALLSRDVISVRCAGDGDSVVVAGLFVLGGHEDDEIQRHRQRQRTRATLLRAVHHYLRHRRRHVLRRNARVLRRVSQEELRRCRRTLADISGAGSGMADMAAVIPI